MLFRSFYSQELDGTWRQHRNRFHIGPEYLAKDIRNPYVFVSRAFWYFGSASVEVPPEFHALIGQRGIRVKHSPEVVQRFLTWLRSEHEPGVHALPAHNPDTAANMAFERDAPKAARPSTLR